MLDADAFAQYLVRNGVIGGDVRRVVLISCNAGFGQPSLAAQLKMLLLAERAGMDGQDEDERLEKLFDRVRTIIVGGGSVNDIRDLGLPADGASTTRSVRPADTDSDEARSTTTAEVGRPTGDTARDDRRVPLLAAAFANLTTETSRRRRWTLSFWRLSPSNPGQTASTGRPGRPAERRSTRLVGPASRWTWRWKRDRKAEHGPGGV
ncbi:hypothetical protein AB0H83_37245 [Dactylosporangium sp. NPDC050688]|uniref:hypothetical protein n=1 Tax=Dactylosporangium sp. NPDC050688 TaxID=3157217 RepID=UPI0033E5BC1B